jgi:hypothetical protein
VGQFKGREARLWKILGQLAPGALEQLPELFGNCRTEGNYQCLLEIWRGGPPIRMRTLDSSIYYYYVLIYLWVPSRVSELCWD